jgi:predicted transcriptional regulator
MHQGHSVEEYRGHDQCCCRKNHHGFGQFPRRFLTKEEKIKKLEGYAQELKNELAAVQERIKELKAK